MTNILTFSPLPPSSPQTRDKFQEPTPHGHPLRVDISVRSLTQYFMLKKMNK